MKAVIESFKIPSLTGTLVTHFFCSFTFPRITFRRISFLLLNVWITLVKKSGFGLLFTAYVQQKIAKRLLIKKILKSKSEKSQITTKRLLRCTYHLIPQKHNFLMKLLWLTGADWPYNEVGKIPRGPSRMGAPKALGGPSASWPFFFRSAWFRFCSNFFFGGPLKKNHPTKIWGASPPLMTYVSHFKMITFTMTIPHKKLLNDDCCI
jgi:hypothetical protein